MLCDDGLGYLGVVGATGRHTSLFTSEDSLLRCPHLVGSLAEGK